MPSHSLPEPGCSAQGWPQAPQSPKAARRLASCRRSRQRSKSRVTGSGCLTETSSTAADGAHALIARWVRGQGLGPRLVVEATEDAVFIDCHGELLPVHICDV